MNKKLDRDFISELILLIAGFIIAETIVREIIENSKNVLPWWVLPLFALGLFTTAISLRNGENGAINDLLAWGFLIIYVVLIFFLRSGSFDPVVYLLLTFLFLLLQVLVNLLRKF